MRKASTVPSTAEASRPIPAAQPTAAVSQRPAAVVRPSMCSSVRSLEDRPGSEKSHPSDDSLENTAQIREWHPSLIWDHNEEGRPESHEHVSPEPGRFADPLSLEAHKTAEQRCKQQAQHDLGNLRHSRQIRKIALYPSPHLMPQGVHH